MEGHAISFGPFRLLAPQRLVLEGDKPVRLGSRAFDILVALVERAGEIVGKEELIGRAWPQTFVEESNLKIQVSALRRALGDGQGDQRYIITVPGLGYTFVAPVGLDYSRALPSAKIVSARAHNLPIAVSRMIGRDEIVETLLARLGRQRLTTILGPGGIGKTTVALAVAERLIGSYEDGVWLVDLAPLADPQVVPGAVATVLGQELHAEDPLAGLVAGLKDKRMLLVLDNCEHLADAAAGLATALLSGGLGVSILATSREPLGIAGECEYRLGPLDRPDPSSGLTRVEAATFPAIQLFVERATAIVEDFSLTDANTPAVAEICRRLDGLPLAIEFAAARVEVLGVEGLAARLDNSLPLLGARRRSTIPRHRTMHAVLDWSHALLTDHEQLLFRATAIFGGAFGVDAAAAVAMDPSKTQAEAIDRLAGLVTKSLLVADVGGVNPRFRLLDTTRAYALEKLDESGERDRVARRHAEYYCNLLERAEDEVAARPTSEWLADYAPEIDNLRAALDWAFSPNGDRSIGVALAAAAAPLWMCLSLLEECRRRMKQALSAFATEGDRNPRTEMRLHAALGASTSQAPEMSAAFTKALDIAERLGDTEYQMRGLSGLHFYHTGRSQYRAALPFAQRFHDLALRSANPYNRRFGERTIGVAKHFLGAQISARHHLEQALTDCSGTDHRWDFIRFQTDLRVSARVFLARVLWLLGFSDQALRTAEESIDEARATDQAISLCLALALAACPIALWVGNLGAAARYTRMLLDHSRKHSLPLWGEFGARFQRVIIIKEGGHDETAETNFSFRSLTGLTELAEAFAHTGRIAESLASIEAGIEQSDGGWATPELLRLKGELFLLERNSPEVETAEAFLRQALDEARRQGALSWELRAATSLARLLYDRHRPADAIGLLQPVYGRFTEGFETADLIAAKRLVDELRHAGDS